MTMIGECSGEKCLMVYESDDVDDIPDFCEACGQRIDVSLKEEDNEEE